jgi:DNA-directed RNA polymerase specialized sigma24 family protein
VEGKPQDERYLEAAAQYGAALHRLATAYEADPDKRRDLLQDVHLALVAEPRQLRRPLFVAHVGIPRGA